MKKVSQWCQLGITILVLVLKLITGQLCRSFILLMDGFHTLFVLGHMALPHPQKPASPSGSSTRPYSETTDPVSPLGCAVFHPVGRRQPVGVFISALLLTSLCVSCLLEMVSSSVEMHPVERPWLLVAVGVVGVLHNVAVFGMTRQRRGAQACAGGEHECYIEVNHKAMSQEGSEGAGEAVRGPCEAGGVQHGTTARSLRNGDLIFCNRVISTRGVDAEKTAEELKTVKEHPQGNRQPLTMCAASMVMVVQHLCTSVLVLVNGLVMLLVGPDYPHFPEACSLLVYLDPSFAILAAIILVAGAVPQMHRYGLLLMQATPPHVSLSDVRERIRSVPGVEEVHELHIWELYDSFMVASVHILCHNAFPIHRCADLMSGVTKVLQSVGVRCCTVQPEFAPPSALPKGPTCPPPVPTCSLACDKLCDTHVCCPLPQEPVMEKLLKQESPVSFL
ncbi:zinc transporter 1 isoform X1 [Hippocampus comes]|uniref:zinc transporter 1 isoform X1 n=1 Tax=Hippocampus comes TaxID=109280 RepID=UPI00094E75E9|nr:PREDICTED: zinc transporter 1-like isoform X1 [Hippocampus comes]